MNETNALSLTQENHSASNRALSENEDSAPLPGALLLAIEATASTGAPDGYESYERGTALKNVGLFRQAAEHFEKAAQDPAYALKGFAQMGLSLKKSGKQEEASRGLSPSPASTFDIIERASADPLPLRENVRVTRAHS